MSGSSTLVQQQTNPTQIDPAKALAAMRRSGVGCGSFEELGYAGPMRVFTAAECQETLRRMRQMPALHAADWPKGHAVTSRAYYDAAICRPLLDAVIERLGPDVMLWGAQLIRRMPGKSHHWHTDIESAAPDGRCVSAWVGLEGTTRESSLRLISRSHRIGITLQQVAAETGTRREDRNSDAALRWAKQHDPLCELIVPDLTDGEAILFDGRLWHGSRNDNSSDPRTALLLQFASPDTPIRIPRLSHTEWPFQNQQTPKPPCIMVSGTDRHGVNRIVPPPTRLEPGDRTRLSVRVEEMAMPLAGNPEKGQKIYPLFRGSTPNLGDQAVHVSVLEHDTTPHPPHHHVEEEILVIIAGEADLTIPETDASGEPGVARKYRVRPGDFVYYPAWQWHTITAAGGAPATYLMFKWHARHDKLPTELQTAVIRYGDKADAPLGDAAVGYASRRLLHGGTEYLRRLHSHLTRLEPGGGYDAHVDAHDVAILTLRGTVETLGRRVGPHTMIYYAGGESHDMRNVGDETAEYLVFEFHGSSGKPVDPAGNPPGKASLHRRAARFAKRTLKRIVQRGGGR